MKNTKIAVVGGGAAGLMSAIIASQNGAKVDIWERNDRIGKKILATGNGKCNFSNLDLNMSNYFGTDLTIPSIVLSKFNSIDAESFFQNLGMMTRSKNRLLYPYSEQASTVLDILRLEITRQNISVYTGELVNEIKHLSSGEFSVSSKTLTKTYDKVIVTCGGYAAPKTGSDGKGFFLVEKMGHKITKCCPALTGLKVADKDFKAISGVRIQSQIKLLINNNLASTEIGELQLTDYGVSGIVVFQLSRIAGMALKSKQQVELFIDLCPEIKLDDLKQIMLKKRSQNQDLDIESFLTGLINKKLGLYLCKKAGFNPNMKIKALNSDSISKLSFLFKNWKLKIIEINTYDQAQVTAGGISFENIDETLQSKTHKGLFFAGEILDVDGKCGGYNLQWAWSSGYVAGMAASQI